MRTLQRISAWLGWLGLAALSALMLLEASGQVADSWRTGLAEVLQWLAEPELAEWLAALLGAVAGLAAVVFVVAQVMPARRVVKGVTIDRGSDGSTEVTSATVYRRISHNLSSVPDVQSVSAVPHRRRLRFRLEVTDSARVDKTAVFARSGLDGAVWSSLGIEPRPVDLVIAFRRGATAVTRKEHLI